MRPLLLRSLRSYVTIALLGALAPIVGGCAEDLEFGGDDPTHLLSHGDDQSDDSWEVPDSDDHHDIEHLPGETGAPAPTGTTTTPSPPPPSTPTPSPNCTPKTYTVRHLQASMLHTAPAAELRSSIANAFEAGADTISWTEIEDGVQVNAIQQRNGWDTFWPSGKAEVGARNAVPVSWRSDTYTLVKAKSAFASEGIGRRWRGKDPVAFRRARHAEDIAKFREVMMDDSVPVVGSADFNTTRLKSMIGGGFAFDVPNEGGSHGDRLIDWILRRPNPTMKLMDVGFARTGSDHRAVRAVYEYGPVCT